MSVRKGKLESIIDCPERLHAVTPFEVQFPRYS